MPFSERCGPSNCGHIVGLRLLMEVAVDVVRDFVAVRLKREMSGGEHIRFKILQVLLVGLGTRWREDEILLSPNDQCRRLVFAEELLKLGIKGDVRPIVVKHVELNSVVVRPIKSALIQYPGCWIE